MAYADRVYYTETYLGNVIPEEDFGRLALRASEAIDDLTKNRAEGYHRGNPAPVANATCAVAEVIFQFEGFRRTLHGAGSGGVVTAESNDGASWTYAAPIDPNTEQGQKAYRQQILEACIKYLRWTGLLYAGVAAR